MQMVDQNGCKFESLWKSIKNEIETFLAEICSVMFRFTWKNKFFTSISTIIHTFYIALSKERICGLMSSTMFELPFCPINSILFFVPFCWATRCHSKVKALDNLIFFQPHKTARSPMQFNVRYKHFTKKAFLTFITQTFSFWRIFVLASTRSLCLFFMSATWVVRKNFKED